MEHSQDDAALLARWRDGDREAGAALFRRHYDVVVRFFVNKVSADEQPDLIQRTFLACVEGRERVRGGDRFRNYLLGIAFRQLYKHYDRRRGERARLDFGTVSVADLDPSPSQVAASQDEQRLLLAALRQIPVEYQVALELVYWEGYSAARLAEVLEVPLGTAKTRIRRGRQLVEAELKVLATSASLHQSVSMDFERWAEGLRALTTPKAAPG
ncbi:MAG: sigma-70 family RNA polymerase sigma factor [Deltaproteobacteria bacterium]|nr:sigma-70 family RNA polymerase sigma factor [Deltaproteobacteria bacterium]